jgi:hypothetical protein
MLPVAWIRMTLRVVRYGKARVNWLTAAAPAGREEDEHSGFSFAFCDKGYLFSWEGLR